MNHLKLSIFERGSCAVRVRSVHVPTHRRMLHVGPSHRNREGKKKRDERVKRGEEALTIGTRRDHREMRITEEVL